MSDYFLPGTVGSRGKINLPSRHKGLQSRAAGGGGWIFSKDIPTLIVHFCVIYFMLIFVPKASTVPCSLWDKAFRLTLGNDHTLTQIGLSNLQFSFSLAKIILSSYSDFYYYCHWTLDHHRVPSASRPPTASHEHPISTYSPRASSLLISSVDSPRPAIPRCSFCADARLQLSPLPEKLPDLVPTTGSHGNCYLHPSQSSSLARMLVDRK